ncbi:glycyl-radical enzyme activating protein [Aminithiophilus ramosus]|uniref:Glycyl-radical enzyme activating protein n=1 Tax=Aminithiophilus ramosus TaxID=3029084 RepID=A0A9Q7EVM3_9BACT|nr:glycyl-radical enzyme activating protein [Aminithiophilus ramosus]QTX32094.1 glycyl-radical enzyme activating protein [Aminithiophilus ramosus]
MTKGLVFDFKRYSIHDGPGLRTTVFLKGCPLSCWWCHNPESQSSLAEIMVRPERCIGCGECVKACPKGALAFGAYGILTDMALCNRCGTCTDVCPTEARRLVGREMSVAEVMDEVERDRLFYDRSGGGMTVSGGEPLMQPRFLLDLLREAGRVEIHRAVDTTGFAQTSLLLDVAAETDLFLYDLKHMDPEKHRLYTGVSNELILHNLRTLAESGAALNVRMPVIPGVNDDAANIEASGAFLAALPGAPSVNVLPYHKSGLEKFRRLGLEYRLAETEEPSPEAMASVRDRLLSFGLSVRVGG